MIDANGDLLPDSTFNVLFTSDSNVVTGFGNNLGTAFTVEGGSLTVASVGYTIPFTPISEFDFDTSYNPGTTGTTGDLVPVPEPSNYVIFAALAVLGFVAYCRRK